MTPAETVSRWAMFLDKPIEVEDAIAALVKAERERAGRKFQTGQRVTKIKGSSWTGPVVGFYSTALTPVGYCVESENEPGSVQVYPEAALEAAPVRHLSLNEQNTMREAWRNSTTPSDIPVKRVCPERDATCPHGMECPYADGYRCHDPRMAWPLPSNEQVR